MDGSGYAGRDQDIVWSKEDMVSFRVQQNFTPGRKPWPPLCLTGQWEPTEGVRVRAEDDRRTVDVYQNGR